MTLVISCSSNSRIYETLRPVHETMTAVPGFVESPSRLSTTNHLPSLLHCVRKREGRDRGPESGAQVSRRQPMSRTSHVVLFPVP